jgi:lipopolysaccharide/colanic/teichoic acid biosynthesis glycosyltransferase
LALELDLRSQHKAFSYLKKETMTNNNQQQEFIYNKGYEQSSLVPSIFSFTDLILLGGQVAERRKDEIDAPTKLVKRAFDVMFSLAVILLGLPVYLALMAITKLTSEGPVFYKQERIGEDGKPFSIIKFRSMRVDAEKFGPQTTTDNDPRITKWGNFMRKTHLDEIPQFFNVLKGDMSIVGPRPERAHFIEQIQAVAPSYRKLQAVKPGITSIGQVYYGYAETVEEMVERMKFDLTYLKEVNIITDIRIIFETVRVMIQGKGK